MSMVKANAAVRRGVKLLDKIAPGWWKPSKISLQRLDLYDTCNCVAGQLRDKGVEGEGDQALWDFDFRFGFDNQWEYKDDDHVEVVSYKELEIAWEREIRARREAAKAAS